MTDLAKFAGPYFLLVRACSQQDPSRFYDDVFQDLFVAAERSIQENSQTSRLYIGSKAIRRVNEHIKQLAGFTQMFIVFIEFRISPAPG